MKTFDFVSTHLKTLYDVKDFFEYCYKDPHLLIYYILSNEEDKLKVKEDEKELNEIQYRINEAFEICNNVYEDFIYVVALAANRHQDEFIYKDAIEAFNEVCFELYNK